jgi:hypothetical protein
MHLCKHLDGLKTAIFVNKHKDLAGVGQMVGGSGE